MTNRILSPLVMLSASWSVLFPAEVPIRPSARPPLPRGARHLSITLTEARDADYDRAFDLGRELGMQSTSLAVAWDDIETAPFTYAPDPDYLAIANLYFPARGLPLHLGINPFDTNVSRIPADLQGLPYDHPQVVLRFRALLDFVFAQIPDLDLASLHLGNEIDASLDVDPTRWQQYRNFLALVAPHARSKRPGLIVGAKTTYSGTTGVAAAEIQALHALGDVVMVTDYPLNPDFTVQPPRVIHRHFQTMVDLYPGRPIYFLELGYPSAARCGSSWRRQAEFVRQAFAAWDQHAAAIPLVEFTWLHNVGAAALDEFEDYYQLVDPNFRAYLKSIGLRAEGGGPKRAYHVLRQAARERGW